MTLLHVDRLGFPWSMHVTGQHLHGNARESHYLDGMAVPALHHPAIVRVVDPEVERALVICRLEDWVASQTMGDE